MLRHTIYLIEKKRGYSYNGWGEATNSGIIIVFKEYKELIPGAIDEFYKKKRFNKKYEVHRWADRHGHFIGYRSNNLAEKHSKTL